MSHYDRLLRVRIALMDPGYLKYWLLDCKLLGIYRLQRCKSPSI